MGAAKPRSGARCFVDEGGRLAKRFALIANNHVEERKPRITSRMENIAKHAQEPQKKPAYGLTVFLGLLGVFRRGERNHKI